MEVHRKDFWWDETYHATVYWSVFRNPGRCNFANRVVQKICTKLQVSAEFNAFHTQACSKDLFHLSCMKMSLCFDEAHLLFHLF